MLTGLWRTGAGRAHDRRDQSLLAPYSDCYQLLFTQVTRSKPGQPAQALQRDRLARGSLLQRAIEPQLNTIWAITDVTWEKGATRVTPGSQPGDDAFHAEECELAFAEMKAGSVSLYTGSITHSGGANQSDAHRIGINFTCFLGWPRQQEN